jgi:hypothetical protein
LRLNSKKLNRHLYTFIIFTVCVFMIQSCSIVKTNKVADSIYLQVVSSNLLSNIDNKLLEQNVIYDDSLIVFEDSLFNVLDSNFQEISLSEFQRYKNNYHLSCEIDSGHFIKGSGLNVRHVCDEVCETYLEEKSSNRIVVMPSGYDAGILAMSLSPACNKLLVCSSYDGPDYANYYEDRAVLFIFNITKEYGLNGIQPVFKFFTKDWSIADIVWVNNKTIALKIYVEQHGGDGIVVQFKYYKKEFNK